MNYKQMKGDDGQKIYEHSANFKSIKIQDALALRKDIPNEYQYLKSGVS